MHQVKLAQKGDKTLTILNSIPVFNLYLPLETFCSTHVATDTNN